MLEEDQATTKALLFSLVNKREDLEQQAGLNSSRTDTERSILAKHIETHRGQNLEQSSFRLLLDHRKKVLLLSLI